MAHRLLLAEDEPAIYQPLLRALARQDYQVDLRTDGPAALASAARGVDVVVLDVGLPRLDGVAVCRRLRAAGHTMPVLMLTARAAELDIVVGLHSGADDYLAKPFRLADLFTRLHALVRHTDDPPAPYSRSRSD